MYFFVILYVSHFRPIFFTKFRIRVRIFIYVINSVSFIIVCCHNCATNNTTFKGYLNNKIYQSFNYLFNVNNYTEILQNHN